MKQILLEASMLCGEEIFEAITQCALSIKEIKSGKSDILLKELRGYLRELKKEAVRLDICPECGCKLRWSYYLDETSDIHTFLCCPECGYKSCAK